MRGFAKFTKALLMLLIIAAIIGSTPYISLSEVPFNFACQFLKYAILPGIGKTNSAEDSPGGGEKTVTDNFVPDDSADKVQDKLESGKGSIEGSGDYYNSGGYNNYTNQNNYQPKDAYSYCYPQQHFDVNVSNDMHVFNVEERDGGSGKEELFLTIDEIKSFKNLGMVDKLKAMAIFSRIDGSSMERICSIADGGITYNEAEEIKLILGKSLTSQHIEQLNDIIVRNKKLLSQGKISDK
ncbi:MAG TPA: hypothetical protein GXX36_00340 [Clostridiaceae bacterium]|nr:hypothetical protein [Clostridiaceae bacterium]